MTTSLLYLDIETRSQINLKKHGLQRYAEDPSTEVICMAYAFNDGPIEFWRPNEPFPRDIITHFEAGGLVMAHNAAFEQRIFEYVIANDFDFNPPKPEQWLCSMAIGLACGFAGSLDALAVGLGIGYRKHREGPRLIREYCSPNFSTEFKPGDAEIMRDYCIGDVEIMRAAVKCLRPLTDEEWEEFHLNARINERGLPIDVTFCEAALEYADDIRADVSKHLARLTDGKMTKHTQRTGRDAWLFPRLTQQQKALLEVQKNGGTKYSLDADHRRALLSCGDLDAGARELLECINSAGSTRR